MKTYWKIYFSTFVLAAGSFLLIEHVEESDKFRRAPASLEDAPAHGRYDSHDIVASAVPLEYMPFPEPADEPVEKAPAPAPVVKKTVNDELSLDKFGDLMKRYETARKKIFTYAVKKGDKNFENLMRNRCRAGSGISSGERAKAIKYINEALKNDQDPKLGVALTKKDPKTKKEMKYFFGDRDFFAMVSTAQSEASGLSGAKNDPNELDNYTHLGQMAGVMYVFQNRVRNDGRDVLRIATVPNAFTGWDAGGGSHIPCMLSGDGWGDMVTKRAVRAFQFVSSPKTKFVGGFNSMTYYFARGGAPFSGGLRFAANPTVVFPNGTKINLYKGVGSSGSYHHFFDKLK